MAPSGRCSSSTEVHVARTCATQTRLLPGITLATFRRIAEVRGPLESSEQSLVCRAAPAVGTGGRLHLALQLILPGEVWIRHLQADQIEAEGSDANLRDVRATRNPGEAIR